MERAQTRALTETFLVRFFDNEITSGTNDLKASFFNLVAFLATPGLLYPVAMAMKWAFAARLRGVDALRTLSLDDKTLYLGMSMVATGLVAAVVWSSLLIDRRDGLVLGVLPVRSRLIVQSKLLAVCGYVGLISLGMHALGAAPFGFLLAAGNTFGFALRGMVAHFVASSLACLFVFAAVLAVQGVWLALLGPRIFARVSAWLQLGLVAIVFLGLLVVPDIVAAVRPTLAGSLERAQPRLFWTPPLWFLGLYETLLGTSNQTLLALGRTAWLALGGAALVAALSYPLAYRRVMRDAVEHPGDIGRVGALTALARWLTVVLARDGVTRATTQFYLSTIGRVERHRFTLALAAGAALAWGLPTVVRWRSLIDESTSTPPLSLLALPLSTTLFLLVGLRVAAAVPSDLRAGWIFEAAVLPRKRLRSGMRRVMLVVGVLPVVAIGSGVYWRLWGVDLAIKHGLLCLAAGLLLVELFLRKADGMPCDQPWRPERANLKSWWPAYFLGFILFASTSRHALAARALTSYSDTFSYVVLLAGLLLGAIALRVTSPRQTPPEPPVLDGLNVSEVLDLN
jgi:hypothetical protein